MARPALLLATSVACAVFVGYQSARSVIQMIAIAISSVLGSVAGIAFSPICGSVLFRINTDTVGVVKTIIICSIANQVAMTWAVRRDIDWRGLRVYLAGGACGLVGGVWVLLNIERCYYQGSLGVFVTAYGLFMLFRRPFVMKWRSAAADFGVGMLSGIAGGAAGFPSGFIAIWGTMKGWDKTRHRAVCQPFILIMQLATLAMISLARGGGGFETSDLLYVPASLLGATIGLELYRRISNIQFGRYLNGMLIISGLSSVL